MMEGLDGTNSTGDVGGSNEAADGEAEDDFDADAFLRGAIRSWAATK